MLDNLTQRLAKVVKTMRGQARLTEDNISDMLREVRMALLEADVALPVVKDLIARIKEKALGQEVVGSLTPGQALIGVVHKELTELMGGTATSINLATQPPAVILMAGLQGAGKTTTTAKIGKLLKERQKKKVLVVSCDVYRPACYRAVEDRCRTSRHRLLPVHGRPEAGRHMPRLRVDHARRHYYDVLFVDTAGRLAIDEAMMAEIKQLHALVKPIETLFVVDAMLGQDAVNTAQGLQRSTCR